MASADNGLTHSPKISDMRERDVFQLYLSHNNKKVEWKVAVRDFSKVWDFLARWVPKDVLKEDLLHIQVTTFYGVDNFKKV